MLYCPQCHRLQDQETAVCSICQGIELRKPAGKDMVVLSQCPQTEANVLCTVLSDAKIEFYKQKQGDFDCCTVMIPYDSWNTAQKTVQDVITASCSLPEEGQATTMRSVSSEEHKEKQPLESRTKKRLTRIVLFVLFILLIWGVVVLSDAGIVFVKGLFTGN